MGVLDAFGKMEETFATEAGVGSGPVGLPKNFARILDAYEEMGLDLSWIRLDLFKDVWCVNAYCNAVWHFVDPRDQELEDILMSHNPDRNKRLCLLMRRGALSRLGQEDFHKGHLRKWGYGNALYYYVKTMQLDLNSPKVCKWLYALLEYSDSGTGVLTDASIDECQAVKDFLKGTQITHASRESKCKASMPIKVSSQNIGLLDECIVNGELQIPSSIAIRYMTYDITEIGTLVLKPEVQKVVLPDSVKCIHASAFEYQQIKEINIPEGIKYVGVSTFARNRLLERISIPSSVKWIGSDAFYGCSSLREVTMSNGLETIGKNAFYGCISLQKVVIPKTVQNLASSAFEGCENIEIVRDV